MTCRTMVFAVLVFGSRLAGAQPALEQLHGMAGHRLELPSPPKAAARLRAADVTQGDSRPLGAARVCNATRYRFCFSIAWISRREAPGRFISQNGWCQEPGECAWWFDADSSASQRFYVGGAGDLRWLGDVPICVRDPRLYDSISPKTPGSGFKYVSPGNPADPCPARMIHADFRPFPPGDLEVTEE